MAKAKPAKSATKAKKPAPKAKATKPAAKAKVATKVTKPALKSARKPTPAKPSKALKPAKPTPPSKAAPAKAAPVKAVKSNGNDGKAKPATAKSSKAQPAAADDISKFTRPVPPNGGKPIVLSSFLKKQQERLLQLRDSLLDAMAGVAKDNLRSRAEGSEASAFGMHQADAGSDAYDRDFALSLLSQEQDALYEIDEALKRVELGTYGVCEMSGKPISHPRLEALPFARYTVECQSQIEKQSKVSRARVPVTSLFGLTDEEPGDKDEEEEPVTNNDKE